jgi:site-specific DNA-methyltransferase (adenine-specific)
MDPNNIPARARPGLAWRLGLHRLLCGDSTKSEDIKRLFAGGVADQLLTDPPYGVNYEARVEEMNARDGCNRNTGGISNDSKRDFRVFFRVFLSKIPLAPVNTCYIFMSGKELHNLRSAFDMAGFTWGNYICWIKNNHSLNHKDYKSKHELILYGWKGSHKFYGDFSTTVLDYRRVRKADLHPTMKPVDLLERLITDGSAPGAVVYDPFGGSGSTLIAAEGKGRVCYTMDINPQYCDVILNRWEGMTGKKAEETEAF